ncbi:MAG: hypothetical protein L0Z51_07340 [Candidatus Latescibacteria bacterium]|nr:hypothetical protein [Candidatus Latescibacterota bacterium]
MKKVLMMALALTMCAGAASADHFGLYSDVAGTSCVLAAPPVGPPGFGVYVVHKFNAGAGAAQFRVTDTTGFFATTQSTIAGLALGTWNDDWSIAYGAACLQDDLNIATLNFLYFGGPLACNTNLAIDPAPTSPIPGAISLVDCGGGFKAATGGRMYFGVTGDSCVDPTGCDPLGVAETTWGGVKALYR